MAITQGINHLGLAVNDLNQTRDFFVEILGWEESGRDDSYPRTAVSDGVVRLTLWQVDKNLNVVAFDRRKNIGLHHLAFTVESEQDLIEVHDKIRTQKNISIEFAPELVGEGPRKHMMCNEPGGIRIEIIWQGE